MLVDVFIQSEDGITRQERVDGSGQVTLGRHTQCTIILESDLVSRQHATLMFGLEAFRVEDTSSNGTMAGDVVLRREAADVPYGTPLVIGNYTVQIFPALAGVSVEAQAIRSTHSSLPAPPPSRPAPAPLGGGGPRTGSGSLAAPRTGFTPPPPAKGNSSPPQAVPTARPLAAPTARTPSSVRPGNPAPPQPPAPGSASSPTSPRSAQATRAMPVGGHLAAAQLEPDPEVRGSPVVAEALGFGPLDRYLADPSVKEILVVDASTIFVERQGRLTRVDARFNDEASVRACVARFIAPLGRRLEDESSLIEARLSDGTRVNAVLSPVAVRGSCITVRKATTVALTLEKLVALETLSPQMALFLTRCMSARRTIAIAGAAGSGRTTLLSALSATLPATERIVSVEDQPELKLGQAHVISLETRPPDPEGRGGCTLRQLLQNAVRMRPDRIVVGDCRGAEAFDLMEALDLGFDGALFTVHGTSPLEALARLERLVPLGCADVPAASVREQITARVHVIVQIARFPDGSRRVTSISEVVRAAAGARAAVEPIFTLEPPLDARGVHRATGKSPSFGDRFVALGLVKAGEPAA